MNGSWWIASEKAGNWMPTRSKPGVPLNRRNAQELEVPAMSEGGVGWSQKQEGLLKAQCVYKALRLHSPGNWPAKAFSSPPAQEEEASPLEKLNQRSSRPRDTGHTRGQGCHYTGKGSGIKGGRILQRLHIKRWDPNFPPLLTLQECWQPGFYPPGRRSESLSQQNQMAWDFPGGAVVKNLPANAGDTGSTRGPGRSHMPRSN